MDAPPPIVDTCPTDIVSDGVITVADVLEVLGQFGCSSGCFADVDGDGAVTVSDVLAVLAVFGEDLSYLIGMNFEICASTPVDVAIALEAGADRVELMRTLGMWWTYSYYSFCKGYVQA